MSESISDFIVTVSVIVGVLLGRLFFKKLKWGWQLLIGLLFGILISIFGHLIVKALAQ